MLTKQILEDEMVALHYLLIKKISKAALSLLQGTNTATVFHTHTWGNTQIDCIDL